MNWSVVVLRIVKILKMEVVVVNSSTIVVKRERGERERESFQMYILQPEDNRFIRYLLHCFADY